MKTVINEHYRGPLLVTEPTSFFGCSFSSNRDTPIVIRTEGVVSFTNMYCLTEAEYKIYVQHPHHPTGILAECILGIAYEEGARELTDVRIEGAYFTSPSYLASLPQPSTWVKFKKWLIRKLS